MGKQPEAEMPSRLPAFMPVGCVFVGFGGKPPVDSFHMPVNPKFVGLVDTSRIQTKSTIKRPKDDPPDYVQVNLPTEDEIVGKALGAPARRVLQRAETLGPKTGWKDGHLTGAYGFSPPDPSSSPTALSLSPGNSQSDIFLKIRTCLERLM